MFDAAWLLAGVTWWYMYILRRWEKPHVKARIDAELVKIVRKHNLSPEAAAGFSSFCYIVATAICIILWPFSVLGHFYRFLRGIP